MPDLYEFEWPVDQRGYEIEHVPAWEGAGTLLGVPVAAHDVIRGRGGPPRYYRPMERPGLWRRLADIDTVDGALAFVDEFGLLRDLGSGQERERTDAILGTAELLRGVAAAFDRHTQDLVAMMLGVEAHPRLTWKLVRGRKGKFEFKYKPLSLRAALFLQAGEAITGEYQFRRCKNCPEWFRLGTGEARARREFCSTRCRVAWSRKQKQGSAAHA